MRKFLLYFLLFLITGCQTDGTAPADLGYDYMPLEVSRFWIYAVDETVYYGEGDQESSTFYYRDMITDSYIGEEGLLIYRVVREKSQDQSNWQNHSVYTLQVKKGALLRSSQNLTIVSFVFPPDPQNSWDGNVYNSQIEDIYSLESLTAYEVHGNTYQAAVKV